MGKKLSQFWYFIGAFVVANVTSFVYHMNSAFAAAYYPAPIRYVGDWDSACTATVANTRCGSNNYLYPSAASKCGSHWSTICQWTGGNHLIWCTGSVNSTSGYCVCTTVVPPQYGREENMYGVTYYCSREGSGASAPGGSMNMAKGVACHSNAYVTFGGNAARYACAGCPNYVFDSGINHSDTMTEVGDVEGSDVMRAGVRACYVTGQIIDKTGLFEYTDRCYYGTDGTE